MKKITTCLWYDHQAEEAAQFYKSVFKNVEIGNITRYGKAGAEVSGQKLGSVMTVDLQIEDIEVQALNGGPMFQFTPALSYLVACSSAEEIEDKWKKLSQGGTARMPLDKYPWADKYAWTTDRYGVEWQLILAPRPHKIVPSFLFVDSLFGKGEEALNFYMSLFPNSKVESMSRDETTKTIMHCSFSLNGQGFALMEGQGKHGYSFTHATSLVVHCDSQAEVDRYSEKLSQAGSVEPCGWVKDRFGVSWQIVPSILRNTMKDPIKADKAMNAILKMEKLDIAAIERAVNS